MEHGIIFWVIVGIIAGALAKVVVPGEGPRGWIGDLIVGLVGALIGGFVFVGLFHAAYHGWVGSTIVAFVGAVILLFIMRAFTTKQSGT